MKTFFILKSKTESFASALTEDWFDSKECAQSFIDRMIEDGEATNEDFDILKVSIEKTF